MKRASVASRMNRAIREHRREVAVRIALAIIGLVSVGIILAGQKVALPGWVPVFGSHRFELKADFSSGQSITPGQGQAVEIAGVRVGDITAVDLVNGHAQVTMQIDNKYVQLIHPDATMLLRPKTGLNDMVIEVDPGVAAGEVKKGSTIPLASTQPNVNPDEVLASLDSDSRGFLNLLLDAGAKGLGNGHGPALSATLRRLEPTTRDLSRISGALAQRNVNIRNAIHNFGLVAAELGRNDTQLSAFVDSSNQVLHSFANQQASITGALRQLPSALRATHGALTSSNQFALQARPALGKLLPGARALAPSLRRARPFFAQTVAPIRDQIRPFTRQVATPVHHLSQAAQGLGGTVPPLNTAFSRLNEGLNALAYDPGGSQQSNLFYIPWLNHDTNSLFLTQDGMGPLRRGMILQSCSTAQTAGQVASIRPFLQTLLQATNQPAPGQIC